MSPRLAWITAFPFVLLVGCGGGGSDGDAGDVVDEDGATDTGADMADVPGDDVAPDTEPDGPAFEFVNEFNADLTGRGSVRVDDVRMFYGSGTVDVLDDPVPAFAYEMTDWSDFDLTLFHLVVPEQDTLNIVYVYCTLDNFDGVYHESFALDVDWEPGTGSCAWSEEVTEVPDPGLRTLEGRPAAGDIVEGFNVSGGDVSFATGPGTIRLGGVTHDLYPFEYVDCTTDCTASPDNGWWELHSLIVDPGGRPCFGILYLMVYDTEQVWLGYPICLDPPERIDEVWLDGSWTAEPVGGGGAPVAEPRHPVLGHRLRPPPRID